MGIDSFQSCAKYMINFFDAGGVFDTKKATDPILLAEETVQADLNKYFDGIPCWCMLPLYKNLRKCNALIDADSTRVKGILESSKNLRSKRRKAAMEAIAEHSEKDWHRTARVISQTT